MEELHTIFFVSRPKDNNGGRPKRAYDMIDKFDVDCITDIVSAGLSRADNDEFYTFVRGGHDDEITRIYASLNAADEKKVLDEIQIGIIKGEIHPENMTRKLTKAVAKPNNALTHRILLDCDDCGEDEFFEIFNDIREVSDATVSYLPTLHGFHVVINDRIDVRHVLERHPNVTNMGRHGSVFCGAWSYKDGKITKISPDGPYLCSNWLGM
jgi:hypothetical protein